MNIHPLAVVSPQAQIGHDVQIAPLAIVEDDVLIGPGCKIAGHAVIKRGTRLGPNNTVCEGAVIGGMPQHVHCPSEVGGVVIGTGNTLREHVTVHRAMKPGANTVLGDGNYLMVGAHVAHDCALANNIIIANGTMLAGHVTIGDRAFLSGAVAVHQFCRIGGLAMIGGHARVVRDVPPFVTIDGVTGHVVGLNLVGLKRNGFTPEQVEALKAAYRVIYRSGLTWKEMLARLSAQHSEGPAAPLVAFMHSGTRGFSQERRQPPGATLKLHRGDEEPAASRLAPAEQPRSAAAQWKARAG